MCSIHNEDSIFHCQKNAGWFCAPPHIVLVQDTTGSIVFVFHFRYFFQLSMSYHETKIKS